VYDDVANRKSKMCDRAAKPLLGERDRRHACLSPIQAPA
jgi:hypothetical protein